MVHGTMQRAWRAQHGLSAAGVLVLVTLYVGGHTAPWGLASRGREVKMVVTGYCACHRCCGWRRNWLGQPVYAGGALAGKRKKVGICADGTKARGGTIAADTRYYSFGRRMYVPGYGYGTVHDRGKGIQGAARLDVFFKSHRRALRWGRRSVVVTVFDE